MYMLQGVLFYIIFFKKGFSYNLEHVTVCFSKFLQQGVYDLYLQNVLKNATWFKGNSWTLMEIGV